MVDGLPITCAQGSNRVWHAVQGLYATLFAMRVLRNMKQRKGIGKPRMVRTRNGKDTITALKRARREALKEASPPIKDMC